MQENKNNEQIFNDKIIQKGIDNKLISFNDKKIIYYAKSEKSYSYKDPEEKVRAIVFIRLVLDYKYNKNDIDFEVKVPRRTPEDLADIVVYEKNNDTQPYIVVECKKDGITDNQFNQAIEQVFGNANSLRAKYAWVVAGNTETAFDVENFNSMERSKNVISEIPTSYGKTSEYRFKKTKDKEKKNSLKIVSREELISTLEKCHQTVWQGGKLNPSDAFDEVSKILFCKLKDEKTTKSNEFYKFQIGTHEESKDVSNRIHKIYEEGKKVDANVFSENIKLDDDIIYKTVEHLQSININDTDLDSKGIAFERFMGDFFKGKMGQYFTPRNIVYFCVQMLDISEYERVLDPACGSGGFLLHAMDTVRKNAEKDFDDAVEIFKHWHNFASDRLFGIEINEQIARVCKMNMIIHDDGHTNVISADTLDNIEKHNKLNEKFIKESFDVILTNPPFGAKVLSSEKKYLGNYILGQNGNKLRAAQSTEILFIERCYEYLKEKGRMAIVLPDGILTNTTLQYVRDFIMEHFRINAIVSIPQTAFSHYGAGVKCSLLFLTKENVSEDYDIFMASAEYVGYDATGRKTDKNDLDEILEEYKNFIEKKNFKLLSKLCFFIKSSKLLKKRIDIFYYIPDKNISIFPRKKINEISYSLQTGSTPSGGIFCKSGIPYFRSQDLDLFHLHINQYISSEFHKQMERSIIMPNDILVAVVGASIGKIALVPNKIKEGNTNQNISRIRIKNLNDISPSYIAIYLNLFPECLIKASTVTTQPYINNTELGNIEIPIPPIEIQDKISNIIQKAYLQKEELEKKSSELLNSINDYVLNELDIKIYDSTKKEKCFTVKSSEIKNKRIDTFWYSLKEVFFQSDKFENKILSELVSISKGNMITNSTKKDGNIPVIAGGKTHAYYNNKSNYNGNIITISASGAYSGYVWYHDYPIWASDCNVLQSNNKDINIKYIYIILKLNQNNIYKLQKGTAQPHVYASDIENIPIPIPTIEIQNKIADEAMNRREKAFKLQEEAKKIIGEAKKEVETMIFK
ncbi:N-6 DNA methylase [Brachyspira hyodysenteriae]|uniref:N-6 DNA methylase n=1 Tax=Brachyspira hyodysenteriae TaxID=159 RepID=UPI0011820BB0|nr:N-6 DNA methylase [Brachyspira hyodysenteriae]TVL66527.1 hypothetical protein A9X85_04135 [Brachyspira hyodysenteriae]TVL76993.1 hypothetical protein A9X79_09065 [Brachyspira hyodysenteriae]